MNSSQGTSETLQRSLLPDRLPELPALELAATYLPGGSGTEFGADWYDVIELPGGEIGIAIGDAVGRGVTAASLVLRLRDGMRAHALDGLGPGEVLRRVNSLATDLPREMATVLLLVFTPESGRLRGASAGHPPGLIRRADGRVERWDAARSLPLGVTADAQYDDDDVRLEPGDAVLLYTDGLVERRGLPLGEALDRLESVVPRAGSADQLRTSVLDAMLGDDDHDDDVAVLVLAVPRRNGSPVPVSVIPEQRDETLLVFHVAEAMRRRQQDLHVVVPATGILRDVLALVSLDQVAPIHDDLQKALAVLGQTA